MTEQHPAALTLGDTVTVTITKTLPFGAFVKTADGTVGLVRDLQNGQNGAVGDLVEIRVDGIDDVKHRFSGTSTN
jgi:predicted RNA-binding protein with RPS1 domain